MKFAKFLIVVISIVLLTGCAKKIPPACSQAGLNYVSSQVSQTGGQFVELGDEIYITVPTWYVFKGGSANTYKQGRVFLNKIAERLTCYTTQSVQVKVYTGTLPSTIENVTLAAQRAQVVTNLLLQYGVSRLVYQNNLNSGNNCINCRLNRIEIVTKRLT